LDDVLSQDLDEREYARRGSENDSVMNVEVTQSRRKLACGQDRVICPSPPSGLRHGSHHDPMNAVALCDILQGAQFRDGQRVTVVGRSTTLPDRIAAKSGDQTGVISSNATSMESSRTKTSAWSPLASAALTRFSVAEPRLTNRWWSSGSTTGVRRVKSGTIVIERSSSANVHGCVLWLDARERGLSHQVAKSARARRRRARDSPSHLGHREFSSLTPGDNAASRRRETAKTDIQSIVAR
jgi:hypothetical protein